LNVFVCKLSDSLSTQRNPFDSTWYLEPGHMD